MTTKYLFLLLFFFTFTLSGCQSPHKSESCAPVRRAAYDIGSGTTKMTVAAVNPCEKRVTEILLEDQIKVDYRESLETSADQSFPDQVRKEGLQALQALHTKAEKFEPQSESAVATAAFREATNGKEFARHIEDEVGLKVRVISQQDEARLGYLAAISKAPQSAKAPVVWDIGGGSQQMAYIDSAGELHTYKNQLGAVHFKNQVIKEILGKDPKTQPSPNPLNEAQVEKAIQWVQKKIRSLPETLKRKIAAPDTSVFGIGGVHFYSIRGQTEVSDSYTASDIRKALEKRTGWTDKKIDSPYAATEITNLILVYAIMKELNIKEVQPLKANLSDALLVCPNLECKKLN